MSNTTTSQTMARSFPKTRWSVVLAASGSRLPEALSALEAICESYWHPLYAYARRSGHSTEDAQDLTQEFFRHFLQKGWVKAADREKGKLRTFLITAFKRFMAKEWRRLSTQRRGGTLPHQRIDTRFAQSAGALDQTHRAPDQEFDHQWAITLLNLAVARLEHEFAEAGKTGDFATLKVCLTSAHRNICYGTVAAQLGISQAAARVSVHRMRKRFRRLYREEIARTLAPGADLEGELRYLAAALSAS